MNEFGRYWHAMPPDIKGKCQWASMPDSDGELCGEDAATFSCSIGGDCYRDGPAFLGLHPCRLCKRHFAIYALRNL